MNLRVITATRGDSALLAETVRSVEKIDVPVRHVLVCPAARQAQLAQTFPRCAVVAERGPGLYAALNTGFEAGEPDDFFTWINDDDVLVAAEFNRALAHLAAEPALDAGYGRVGLIDAGGRPLGEIPVARRPGDLMPLLAGGIMPLAQPGTVFRWRVREKIGAFDLGYTMAGDLDYFVRALQAGQRFGFHDGVTALFRLQARQLSKDRPTAALEHAQAIEKLPHLPARGARWRFRWDNRGVYWQRLRQHGFKRMEALYAHG